MSPEQHNKVLGISHLAYGAFYVLLILGFLLMFGFMGIALSTSPERDQAPPLFVFGVFWIFMAIFYGVFTIPSLIAGYALLRRRRWAKIAAIVAGVMSAMMFPIGTAVCVYTFWFFFSEPGKLLYEIPAVALPPQPPQWGTLNALNPGQLHQPEYKPPASPPDWR